MSSFTDNPNWKNYDVYLSFCVEDAGSFATDIYTALSSEDGIVVFWDDDRLGNGDREIPTSSLNVIGECKIVIIVFSRKYVDSVSCLQELEKITECCRNTDGFMVLPVLYDGLHPSDGSLERGMFGEAFHDFLNRISIEEASKVENKFMTWVAAISNSAFKYSGSSDFVHGFGSEYIKNIVEHVTCVINKRGVSRDFYTASVKSSAQDVIQLLNQQSKSPFLLGIWGMPGIGKSTISQAIYDQIGPYFEHKCFLKNIRDENDEVSLQQKLLFHMDKLTEMKIPTIEPVSDILKERLQHKRVLLVLDGVDKLEQLKVLCGNGDWFGPGSKIIITARDRCILKEHGVDHIYPVKELDENESLELFNWGVFSEATTPPEDFVELSRQIVAYSGGLPLALKALGRFLHRKDVLQWKGVLSSLEKVSFPDLEVLEILETSLDDLSNEEKQIFLDIACFFNGMDKNDVLHTLNKSTQSTTLQISFLEDNSLLIIDENNKLQMHVLLQAMARYIIKRESSYKTDQPKMYDVFLSFRGEYSCAKFMSHLYSSLQNAGVYAFKDDGEIQRGDHISLSLLRAIGQSRISIVVLSINYANSRWCMLELEKIMEIGRLKGLVVVPVFYEVDPSEVRRQQGHFGKAFEHLISRISVDESTKSNWRRELIDICGIAGFVLRDSRNERADIKNLVEHVARLLDGTELFVTQYPVGLESRVEAAVKLLNIQKSDDVLILGIWGMGGMGKITLAKAIYNQIGSKFEGRSFLLNVRELWETDTNQVSLQQQILSDVYYQTSTIKICNIESGKYILKERLAHKRALVVLDDVNEVDQVKALCGSHEWFGPGSRIIITTRDMHLLRLCSVDQVYTIEDMSESESLELFSWHAFNQPSPTEDFATLSTDVVAYSGRLPLALEVLGSYLFCREIIEWRVVLAKLEHVPNAEVQKKLKVSFDGLKDVTEKQTFLDIACLYIGMDKNDVVQRLNMSTESAAHQISLLEDKSLVTIDETNKLQMHVLLQAMARDIIGMEPSIKTNQPKIYDVFLSFRGEDSRAKFVSHLYSALQNSGIYVFRDDDEIQRGDQISISLLRSIEQSKISIVVLSTNYANSRWCMLELEKIMEICRDGGLVVVPVFYDVDPSEVRHQEGRFGEAFEHLISTISVDESTKNSWRRDLVSIGGRAGFVLIDSRNENENGHIKNIVEHVTRLLGRTELFVAEHPVGVESRVEAATKVLNIQKSEDVLILGIWGMGGMGKTTLAKAIYNQIGSKFEGRSFLLNVRELWETDTNQVSLQQRILSDVYKTLTFKIGDIEAGKNMLKERLAKNKVLLVLDDVNKLEQLKALCGSLEWFGPGSRIIITTRDMHLLRLSGVYQVYATEEMNESEALELFSWHAFKQPSPTKDFATLSTDVVAYSGRLPLALEVLGSYLSDCEITEWDNVLAKLKSIPHGDLQEKLKVSFDGLKDFTEKQIFLDIACFFIGMDKNDVIQILNGCGFFADIGIKVLVERALVTVDNKNKLRMHDMLRDMGRQIIDEESPSDPEKRSRLWRHEEVFDILAKRKGTEAVKGLALEFPRKDCLETKAFKKMNKLRLLRLAGVKLNGDFKYLSGDLRWLYWHGFPETYTPTEFQQESLVAVELTYSKLKQIWNKCQMLENLKILNLSHSLYLTETPDFSYLPNLEKLELEDCPSLTTVSHSIGSLHKILLINLTDCTGLQKLPRSIYKLKSLESLILSGCSMLDKLEEELEQMESLINLIADKTSITKVPLSIVSLKNIGYISVSGFEGFSRDVFPSLIWSWLSLSPSNNIVDKEDVVVSCIDDNNVSFSGGDNIGVQANNNDTGFDPDEIISEDKHCHGVEECSINSDDDAMQSNKNYANPGGSDMPTDKKVILCSEDENVSDINNWDAVDKDIKVSSEADKNVVSVGDKNRFYGLFTKLPSLVRAVLMSRPFWSSLVGIMIWITCRHFKKGRSPDLLTRYTQRGKWLLYCAQKLFTYKKANEAHSRSRQLQS